MPRLPSSCPRSLPILVTGHARLQALRRRISEKEIKDVIVNGRELALDEQGQKGGFISKFYKTYVDRSSGVPMSKTVVAVCETFDDRYVLVTTYQEGARAL